MPFAWHATFLHKIKINRPFLAFNSGKSFACRYFLKPFLLLFCLEMNETIVQTALCSSYKKIQELLLNSNLWSLKVVPRAHLPTNKSWSPLIFFVWSLLGQFLIARECFAYRQTTKIARFILALIYYKNWEEKRDPSITNYLNSRLKF